MKKQCFYSKIVKCHDEFTELKLYPKINEPFTKECDLTPIIEFLRVGGAGYGYPNCNAQ